MHYLLSASDIPNITVPPIDYAREITGKVVEEVVSEINITGKDFLGVLFSQLPPELFNKLSRFLDIGTYVLIAILTYLIFKIVRLILSFRDSRNLRLIAEQTIDINSKIETKKK